MTDRELLEMAAKAAGIKVFRIINDPILGVGLDTGRADEGLWNPLENGHQALNLAVALRIDLCTDENDPHPTEGRQICHINAWPQNQAGCSEDRHPDPYAATRRAIVRAAARIGAGKEEE